MVTGEKSEKQMLLNALITRIIFTEGSREKNWVTHIQSKSKTSANNKDKNVLSKAIKIDVSLFR